MDMLRRAQLSDQEILERYIPEVAQRLGCFWIESVMSFAQVTIVAARLQLMVREVEFDQPRKYSPTNEGPELSILVVVCENEMHTLGCVTLATILRNSGHSVRQMVGATQSDFRKAVKQDWYDLILFSCARKQSLEFVSSLVIHVRKTLRTAPPLIVGGAVLAEISDAAERTGVDLATNDLQLALKLGDTRCLGKNLVAE
jgi:methanogenic corrinoid protein MtbC1